MSYYKTKRFSQLQNGDYLAYYCPVGQHNSVYVYADIEGTYKKRGLGYIHLENGNEVVLKGVSKYKFGVRDSIPKL